MTEVREEDGWPLARTRWTPLHLGDGGLAEEAPAGSGSRSFGTRTGSVSFTWRVPRDTEVTGPMAVRLWVEVQGADDVDLMVGVEKWRHGTYVPFEGSYGFGRDRVATGWQKASLRELDPDRSTPSEPVPTFARSEPLRPGEVVPVEFALGPSATRFRAGEELRLVVGGRWLWPRNPLTGQFPAHYRPGPGGRCTLHWGPDRPARLLVPVVPPPA